VSPRHLCAIAALWVAVLAAPIAAAAQTPRRVPAPGYTFLDEQRVDRFVVQRWASADSPRDSPSGFCECITLVFDGQREVLNLGESAGTQQISTLADVTGDRRAELVVVTNSGGAHCCESTSIYSVEGSAARPLLSVMTDDCPGQLVDLDGDGRPEFQSCDASFGYEFCSFAFSPLPPVVFAYEPMQRRFVLATRRYARRLPPPSDADIKSAFDTAGTDPELRRCAALRPALHTIYTAGVDDGLKQFRELYHGADGAAVEARLMQLVRASSLWTPP
jgi:hypothetical protein